MNSGGMSGSCGRIRALATTLILALVSAAFSPATTGCSGGPGASPDSSVSAGSKATVYYIDDHLGKVLDFMDAEMQFHADRVE